MKYVGLGWVLIGLSLLACGGRDTSATATERTQHVLLLANTSRADSLAALIRQELPAAPYPARLSDISRVGESLGAISARLPWALQQGVDICVLDLYSETTASDSLRSAIEVQIRRANPDIRLVKPDSNGYFELFPTARPDR